MRTLKVAATAAATNTSSSKTETRHGSSNDYQATKTNESDLSKTNKSVNAPGCHIKFVQTEIAPNSNILHQESSLSTLPNIFLPGLPTENPFILISIPTTQPIERIPTAEEIVFFINLPIPTIPTANRINQINPVIYQAVGIPDQIQYNKQDLQYQESREMT